jgi:hypothetical protein
MPTIANFRPISGERTVSDEPRGSPLPVGRPPRNEAKETVMSQTVMSRPVTYVVPELLDRCDRCGAKALLSLVLGDGGELAFCGHHGNRFAEQILTVADRVAVESGFAWRGAGAAFDLG